MMGVNTTKKEFCVKFKIAAMTILCLSIMGVIPTESFALDQAKKTLEKGIGQYRHENYDEALATLKRAKEEDPRSAMVSYYLGLTYKRLEDYESAIPHLKDAVSYDPKMAGPMPELIDCLYQTGDIQGAKAAIAQAQAAGLDSAQVAFLNGLVLMKDGKWEDAVESFKNAKALDPSMSQSCNYYTGMAYLKGKKLSDAQKAFTEVVLINPNSNMSNFANEYVDTIARQEDAARPLKFTFDAAWQYDDNVVLKPDDSAAASSISDKADSRQVYTASGEYNHMFNDNLGLRGLYTFYYAKQSNLGFYDMVVNNFIIQPSIYFTNGLLTFPSGYSHTLVNDKAYLSRPFASGLYNFMLGDNNMCQLSVKYQNDDYLWNSSSGDESMSGNDLAGGIGWYAFFANKKGFFNLHYAVNQDWTKGKNWTYFGNKAGSVLSVPILEKFNVSVSGDFYFQNFAKSHTDYHVYRKDAVYTLSTLATYKFFKDCELQMQYTYISDNSNIAVYEYDRNIYSVGVEIRF